MFEGKSILITGGTGSFGQACVKRILEKYQPRRVIVFSRDEYKQYEMSRRFTRPEMRYFLGDVRDLPRLTQAMNDVQIVIHAAAMKQVPAAEENPMECIKTNVHGAENIITASIGADVERVIALSTDKAANPINLYGASKLASDKLFTAANNIVGKKATRFSVVRYGNVHGSRGSIVPLFKQLVADGVKELPITDSGMTRFWITIGQGVDFVLECFTRMHGGEIYVPKIPSVRVVDIAEAIGPGLKQKIIGIRPGEKLHEIMVASDDGSRTLEFGTHYLIKPTVIGQDFCYDQDRLDEIGKTVAPGFEYTSDANPIFMSVDDIRNLLD